jgi:hypothetical protein
MRDARQWIIRVQYHRGRRRYYGPDGKEIPDFRIQDWQVKGWLRPHDPGLFDEPQSYLFVGWPPPRWAAV